MPLWHCGHASGASGGLDDGAGNEPARVHGAHTNTRPRPVCSGISTSGCTSTRRSRRGPARRVIVVNSADMDSRDVNKAIAARMVRLQPFPRAEFHAEDIGARRPADIWRAGTDLKGRQRPVEVPFTWTETGDAARMTGELIVRRGASASGPAGASTTHRRRRKIRFDVRFVKSADRRLRPVSRVLVGAAGGMRAPVARRRRGSTASAGGFPGAYYPAAGSAREAVFRSTPIVRNWSSKCGAAVRLRGLDTTTSSRATIWPGISRRMTAAPISSLRSTRWSSTSLRCAPRRE